MYKESLVLSGHIIVIDRRPIFSSRRHAEFLVTIRYYDHVNEAEHYLVESYDRCFATNSGIIIGCDVPNCKSSHT